MNQQSQHLGASQSPASFAHGKRFFVVEDDKMVAQALMSSLQAMGGEAKCFYSAEDALDHANIGHADCYIVDYMLGGPLNGIEFLNLLRQKLGKPINAVLMTGDTSVTFVRHAANCDWPVLHKPVNASRLISNLSAHAHVADYSRRVSQNPLQDNA